ncbi:hypothetical protein D3C80_841660 [compost metagenome]
MALTPTSTASFGILRFIPDPGWNKFAKPIPSKREINDAPINQLIAFKVIDPKEDDFPIEIKPETIVANTKGAIIILINLKNTSVTILKYAAISVVCAVVKVL